MTELERKVNEINEEYFLPLLSDEMWQEDYISIEYNQAKNFLKPFLQYFKKKDQPLLTQIFKSHIKYFKWVTSQYPYIVDSEYKEDAARHNQYKKMIPKFVRVMRSFQFATSSGDIKKDIAFQKRTKLFEINRIVFEGTTKNNKIALEGDIINVIRAFFDVLGRIDTEDQLRNLRIFSNELYYAYWDMWFTYIKKLSKVKQGPTPKTKIQMQNFFRNTKAFQLHRFLKDYSSLSKGNQISEKEKKFIGDFFLLVKIAQDEYPDNAAYLDTVHYNDVRNWILRGRYL